ncbi:unnamed protein product [Staurois parvus]|uniref:Uncharacterized protein n=1 Tax=Staurois parvus TaxID=386267 RepID=A0ABN9F3K5_9NEOB|nr:unnamed protein product [Staurois parvus]
MDVIVALVAPGPLSMKWINAASLTTVVTATRGRLCNATARPALTSFPASNLRRNA